jgi:hypothetical protein
VQNKPPCGPSSVGLPTMGRSDSVKRAGTKKPLLVHRRQSKRCSRSARGWIEPHNSDAFVKLTQGGADLFADMKTAARPR